ncbi:MAG: hypothetical protein C0601_10935 [Candidatus Muiribacterium halophilum]|uniref:Response regulatory domain-containing protein n=1 Tax=Muiribacterium halophilum TaxID=2053465 RepID=A0A2N5ZBS7_MUIH1|nr:MAG: hypothetical protein C0601_10935 [Candidatus Muirbacterium halophilum]
MKILALDDDIAMTNLIKAYAKKLNYSVEVINNPDKLLEKIARFNPDLIILDLMMPKKDGLSLLKSIKEMELFKHIPVLIISARANRSTILSCLSAGAIGFLPKPIGLDLLSKRLHDIFDEKES